MHNLLRNLALCGLFLFSTLDAFSTGEYTNKENIQSSILSLLNGRDKAISLIESDGKVYLKPEAIVPTEQGLFVKTESGDYLEIPFLISGEHGCYTVLNQSDSTVYPVIRCKNCNTPFSPTIFNQGKCPRCGTQN